MQCNNPFYLSDYGFEVPCGSCRACKIAKAREWTIRLLHELSYHETGCFLTLTYDNDHLPHNNSINKRDLQLFFKLLRYKYPFRIKYFACGEYGDVTFRPHYHVLIFGIDKTQQLLINSCWKHGFIHYGYVSRKSIGYVVGYISKKYNGRYKDEKYTSKGLECPFQLQSQGIGFEYALDNFKTLNENLCINYQGAKVKIPRYYLKKFKFDMDRLSSIALEYSDKLEKNLIDYHSCPSIAINRLKATNILPQAEHTLFTKLELFKRNKI